MSRLLCSERVLCLQEAASLKPGWVRMRYTADGVTVAWHAAAHPLSLPVPVVAPPDTPLDPIGEIGCCRAGWGLN